MVAELPGSGTLAAMMLLGAIVAAMLVLGMEADARPGKGGQDHRDRDRRTRRNQVPQNRLWSPQEPHSCSRNCKRLQSMLGLFPRESLGDGQRVQEREVLRSGSMCCVASWFQPGKPRNFVPVDDEPRNTQRGSDAVAGPWPLATTTAATTTTRRSRKNLPLEMVEPSRMRAVGE